MDLIEKNKKEESLIYNYNGDIIIINEYYNNKPFFRKYTDEREMEIIKILINNSNDNICEYYRISNENKYIDMELLDIEINKIDTKNIIDIAIKIKKYLQSIGIIYIDWKLDQFGIDKKGNIKLFDFNSSGIIDIKTNKWIIEPYKDCWSYKKSLSIGLNNPYDIDNYSFKFILK